MAFANVPAWSATAASNTSINTLPLDGAVTTAGQVDDIFREMMAQIGAFTRRGADTATATTLDLDATPNMFLNLTGTTTVTAITLTDKHSRRARAVGAFLLTAGASLIVNGSTSSNYTTTADDLLFIEGFAAGVVRVWVTPVSAISLTAGDARYRKKGSGRMLAAIAPTDQEFFGSLAATVDVRNNHPIAVFPDAVVNLLIATVWLDADYAAGGITVDIDWLCSTTSTNKACFGVYVERVDNGTTDFDSDSFGSETIDTTGVAANATSGIASRTTIAISAGNTDSAVAGDKIRLKIARETGQANDTNAGDIQVLGIRVTET